MARSTTQRLGPTVALLGLLALACGVIASRGACTERATEETAPRRSPDTGAPAGSDALATGRVGTARPVPERVRVDAAEPPPVPETQAPRLVVEVTSPGGGPVAGASVALTIGGKAVPVRASDAGGRVAFAQPKSERGIGLEVTHPAYARYRTSLDPATFDAVEELVRVRLANATRLRVTVTDGRDALPGHHVWLWYAGNGDEPTVGPDHRPEGYFNTLDVLTGDNGTVELRDLYEGHWEVKAWEWKDFEQTERSRATTRPGLVSEVVLTVERIDSSFLASGGIIEPDDFVCDELGYVTNYVLYRPRRLARPSKVLRPWVQVPIYADGEFHVLVWGEERQEGAEIVLGLRSADGSFVSRQKLVPVGRGMRPIVFEAE